MGLPGPMWAQGLALCLTLTTLGSCQEEPSGNACEASEVFCGVYCVDTSISHQHCGACDWPCYAYVGGMAHCVAGVCVRECDDGFMECNGNPDDGCEHEGETCPSDTETDCYDGLDNDADGLVDCVDDDCDYLNVCGGIEHDCEDGLDDDQDAQIDCDDDDCSGDPLCLPEADCYDGVDNDGDGVTDCDDTDCAVLPACAPACPTFDLAGATGDAVATGDSTGYVDDFPSTAGCGDVGSSGEDIAFSWTPLSSGCFRIDTDASNYDTVLRVHEDCAGPLSRCDDDSGGAGTSRLNLEAGAGVVYAIVIDGHAAGDAGTYVLDINYIGPACP